MDGATMPQTETSSFRLSPQQARLWELEPDGPTTVAQCAVALEGELDPDRLRRALDAAIERHEILRTTFRRPPGMQLALQVVQAHGTAAWRTVDAERVELEELLAEEAVAPFDLATGPLARVLLAKRDPSSHVLVITLPALCADGASLTTLARELLELYGGEGGGSEPLQYADFAEWQSRVLDERAPEPAEDAGAGGFSLLLGREPGSPFSPRAVAVGLGAAAGEPESILLAAWTVLLARLSDDGKARVAVVADGRHHPELRNALGPLAKGLPMTVSLLEGRPFDELAADVARTVSEGTADWERLRADAAAAGDMLVWFEAADLRDRWRAGDLEARIVHRRGDCDRYALKLECALLADGSWEGRLWFDPDCVRGTDAERLAQYLEGLLVAAIEEPAEPANALDFLPPDERLLLLEEWNATHVPAADAAGVHELFEAQAERAPDRVAVRAGGASLTYRELNERANQLASRLRALGVGRDAVVGLFMDRSIEMLVGLLGILKAGGAYLPLHTEHPRARLLGLLAEAKAPVLVTKEMLAGRLEGFAGHVLCLDRDRPSLEEEPKENAAHVNAPEDLVYVMYTSGSTGVPKGVAVTHRGLLNYATAIARKLEADQEPLSFALVSAISTDLGNTGIFASLVSGGTLHLVDPEVSMDGAALAREAAERPYDVLKITPSHLSALLSAGDAAVLPRRWLVLGGEAATWDLVERVRAASSCGILNHYGPTEATVGSCTFDLATDLADAKPATVPIGRPIANTKCYVLDGRRAPVPVGVTGELYLGGAGLARGYLGQPEETALRFVDSPFETGERLYATGDLARFLPDGNIEFRGRADVQVKIRGYRVELAEVEAVLARHPAVTSVAVVAREDPPLELRLVAYIVAEPEPSREELRAHAAEFLPDYMLPAAFVFLPSLPMTPSGKIDRLALPAPETRVESDYVAPSNAAEEQLAGIWADVLGLERVGVQDDFFELGGHSLLATQVIARARNALGVQVPLNVFFNAPTVAGLAAAVAELQAVTPPEDDLARLLDDLESLSDEEAERLLAAELGRQGEAG